MKDYIEERVLELAAYVLETQTTVRGAKDVKHVLDNNKAERHIRGGQATRKKYMSKKGMS